MKRIEVLARLDGLNLGLSAEEMVELADIMLSDGPKPVKRRRPTQRAALPGSSGQPVWALMDREFSITRGFHMLNQDVYNDEPNVLQDLVY